MGKTLRINLHIDEDCDGPLYAVLDRLPPKKRASKIRLLALLSIVRDEMRPKVTGVTETNGDLFSSSYETPAVKEPGSGTTQDVQPASETSLGAGPTKANEEGFADLMDFSLFETPSAATSNVGTSE